MRLYTADAIEEQMHKLLCRDCEKSDVCSICDYRELIDEILDAPTVDAEPVRHGRWMHDKDDVLITGYCSKCGWTSIIDETDVADMPFCPNCGAKMDREERR